MQKTALFNPGVPPDLDHAPQIREEAFDWLDSHHPGQLSFTTGEVLRMAGEQGRRWLIGRLRTRGIGDEELFSLPATADALTVLFLRSRGMKFREAVDAVVGGKDVSKSGEPRYGGVWNRLIVTALDRLRRRVPPRLIGSALSALLHNQEHYANCLLVVKRHGRQAGEPASGKPRSVSHEYVFRTILERPSPSCSVIAPSLEVLFLGKDQLPTRGEVTARHFVELQVATDRELYELLIGTMRPSSVSSDDKTLEFVGRILDIVFIEFEEFHQAQSSSRFDIAIEPEAGSADDLQLWLVTQFLDATYSGALCEVIEMTQESEGARALASSASKPWEPSLWEPAKSAEMLSGYASAVAVPLVVPTVEYPWTMVIKSVEQETRYLRNKAADDKGRGGFSAMALPIMAGSGSSIGSLYMLMPRLEAPRLEVETRVLTVFSRIVGEIIERQRAAVHSANVSANLATSTILKREQFKDALLELLNRKAVEIRESEHLQRDLRLPFLLLSSHRPDPEEFDPVVSDRLGRWLVETMEHLEWRSFVRSHWPEAPAVFGAESFIGELPGVGVVIALGKLVSKYELDRIRNVFPTTINRISPSNAPVKLVAWVLDVPAQRISDGAKEKALDALADEVERWAFEVATVVDDVTQSMMAQERGDWDAALRRVRKALQKESGRTDVYLRRLAADCSFSLGEWHDALKYAQGAAKLSRRELGSGLVRSLCQEGDAHLCLCDPTSAWDLYSEAASHSPTHPLPRYYRGQGLILMARLLHVFEDERRRAGTLDASEAAQIEGVIDALVNGVMEDLTVAADLLDRWGLIPEAYQYRNFHLVPTLLGQGAGYLLARSPGPAAVRLQSARRSFPKDDMFFREFIFAKCWEQGLHRRYGALLLGEEWAPLRDRLHEAFGEPQSWHRSQDG